MMKTFFLFLLLIVVFLAGIFVATPNNPLSKLMRDPGGIVDDTQNSGQASTVPPVLVPSTVGPTILSSYSGSYALLIGESRYQHRWSNLGSIPGELQQVAQLLTANGFQVDTALNLTSRQLKDKVEQFINQHGFDENNRLLFFYSGHGYSSGERGYIVPIDAPNPGFDKKVFAKSDHDE
jgi:hypothetical protein